ncbi:hypothetical protein BDQ17DRAFT_1368256 [Cyathus striatus]|nr:hypothetical protein BDQ17DRAFT_1368256 [Cyathus striatus]
MASKAILVTGSNNSIGFEVVRTIWAQKGHSIYLVSMSLLGGKNLAKQHWRS